MNLKNKRRISHQIRRVSTNLDEFHPKFDEFPQNSMNSTPNSSNFVKSWRISFDSVELDRKARVFLWSMRFVDEDDYQKKQRPMVRNSEDVGGGRVCPRLGCNQAGAGVHEGSEPAGAELLQIARLPGNMRPSRAKLNTSTSKVMPAFGNWSFFWDNDEILAEKTHPRVKWHIFPKCDTFQSKCDTFLKKAALFPKMWHILVEMWHISKKAALFKKWKNSDERKNFTRQRWTSAERKKIPVSGWFVGAGVDL